MIVARKFSVSKPKHHSPQGGQPTEAHAAGNAPIGWRAPAALIIAMWASILSTDLYTPSLPELDNVFGTTDRMVKLTMSVNFIGYAIGPFFVGPFADHYGRRRVLWIGLILFMVTSLLCMVAPTIEILIALRGLQGAVGSVSSVLCIVMIRDLYRGPEAIKILSLYGASIGLAPAVGPLLGGWIHVSAGWWANFLLLAILGLIAGVMVRYSVPEGGGGAPFNFALAFRRYRRLLRNTVFLRFALAIGATFAGLFAYITIGPYLFIERFGVPVQDYGLYYGASVIAYILGATIANRWAGHASPLGLTKTGTALSVSGAIVFLIFTASQSLTIASMMFAMCLFSLGLGMLFAAAPVLMFATVPKALGAAAGVLFSISQSAGAALGALSVALLHGDAPETLAVVMLGFAAFAAGLVFAGEVPDTGVANDSR